MLASLPLACRKANHTGFRPSPSSLLDPQQPSVTAELILQSFQGREGDRLPSREWLTCIHSCIAVEQKRANGIRKAPPEAGLLHFSQTNAAILWARGRRLLIQYLGEVVSERETGALRVSLSWGLYLSYAQFHLECCQLRLKH